MGFSMVMAIRNWVVAGICILMLSACTGAYDESMQNLDDDKSLAKLKEFQGKVGFDFSKVAVATLKIDDKQIKITSLRPEKISGFKVGGEESVTMAVFNKEKNAIILFTRDAEKKMGFEIQLPLAEFEQKKEILFPVADSAAHKITNKTISLAKAVVR
jgi:hypothetical protein